MDVDIILTESVGENASRYFDAAKKSKKKQAGARQAIERARKELEKLQQQEQRFFEEEQQRQQQKPSRKKEWYEKFHWFMSSEGYLCVGGRDATSNDIIIKKHLEDEDLVLHTDMAGSPFFLIKNGRNAGPATIQEAAQATAVYSKAWKLGYGTADVFYVKPEQVSKEAKSGEYLQKGSFMIYGKTTYIRPSMEMAIGVKEGTVLGGPVQAVQSQTKTYVTVIPGTFKKSELAKKIKVKLKGGELDEMIAFLPAGGGEIKRE